VVGKGRHTKNDINKAFDKLDKEKFAVQENHKGHRWGYVVCENCGTRRIVPSTPKNPSNEANHIIQFAKRHNHQEVGNE